MAEYDAATKHLGPRWRMPTDAEWSALISNCTTTWTTHNGVLGCLVTGKGPYAAKSIFLPAAGDGIDDYLLIFGSHGYYWSSAPFSNSTGLASCLIFYSDEFWRSSCDRNSGLSVRPVRAFAQ